VVRIRESLVVALSWGMLFALIGMTIGYVIWYFDPDSIDPGEHPIVIGGIIGVLGLMCGALSAAVVFAGRRVQSLRQVSLGQCVLWGAIASAAVPLVTWVPNGMVPMSALMGVVAALATHAIFRRPIDLSEQAGQELARAGRAGN
jgi:hypothetical protein